METLGNQMAHEWRRICGSFKRRRLADCLAFSNRSPAGTPHGANAFCVTADDQVVLISNDGVHWGWPGGRPEGSESWEQTLRREILEETCSIVSTAQLLGFCEVCASVVRRRTASWSAPYGGQKLSCCYGSQGSKSCIDELSPRMNCSRICGWRTASNRSIVRALTEAGLM